MRVSTTVTFALSVSAALALLAGCSGGGSQLPAPPLGPAPDGGAQSVQRQVAGNGGTATVGSHPVTTPSFMDLNAVANPLIFVSDPSSGVVNIFPQAGTNQNRVGQISGLNQPQGLATDIAGNLYIANTARSDVLVYAPPYTRAAALKLADPGKSPFGVAVSPLGVVGVTNCTDPSCTAGNSVTFYAKNTTTACATVADPTDFAVVYYAAFDDDGNLYITGGNTDSTGTISYSVVGEIVGGCAAKKIAVLLKSTTPVALPGGGIQIDSADRIAIQDDYRHVINTYNPPINGSLGKPISTTPLTSAGDARDFAFLASGVDFYNVDNHGRTSTHYLTEYDYPAGGASENSILSGGSGISPFGSVAVTPPLVP